MPIHLLVPRLRPLGAALLLLPLAAACGPGLPDGLYAEITTPRGVITCELDASRAPLTVANFVGLAEGTLGPSPRKPFFDGLTFHRVVPSFVIQGGDPLGTGEGGPGYSFPDEFSPALGHDAAGVLSMANDGPDTNGSQFFITLGPFPRLNYLHSVFGRTVGGLDVLGKVAQGDAMRVRILRVGTAARGFRADGATFERLLAATPKFTAAREPGPTAHFDDPDKVLPTDPSRAQSLNLRLANVERSTGVRIYARVYARFVPGAQGGSPDALAESLSRSLGLADNGVLALHFADSGSWVFKVGRSTAPRFTSDAGKGPNAPGNGPLDAAFARLVSESRVREAQYLEQSARLLPNFLQIPGQRTKVAIDAILDGILAKTAP